MMERFSGGGVYLQGGKLYGCFGGLDRPERLGSTDLLHLYPHER